MLLSCWQAGECSAVFAVVDRGLPACTMPSFVVVGAESSLMACIGTMQLSISFILQHVHPCWPEKLPCRSRSTTSMLELLWKQYALNAVDYFALTESPEAAAKQFSFV